MGKKAGKSSGAISNGLIPSVNRKFLNAARRDRRANPTVASMFQSINAREMARGELKKRHEKEDSELRVATDLFARYEGVADWSACVHAAKTDWVSQFNNKYGAKLSQNKG